MAMGVQNIPLTRIPKEWSAEWFARWTREVLVNVDIRNAIEGEGIQITGQPDEPATITASADILALKTQTYVTMTSSAFLPNERVLAGQAGIITITDGGAGNHATVGLDPAGLPIGVLQPIGPQTLLGNPTDVLAVPTIIFAASNDTVARRTGDVIDFGQLTIGMAPDALWTYAKIQDATALSVLGRASNADGVLDEIVASVDGDVLRRSGSSVGFGDIILRTSNFANPSATVGLTAVNGSAVTAMRSDGAPALNVTISPTWSGTHTFNITPVVPNDSWTYAKIQNVSATSRFLGRITTGAGDIEELTGTQATTLLDAFTSSLQGVAPASGGGTTNFLRADGSWASPGTSTGANPTASVGLTAVNGSASTFLRSDGAPALDQGISPVWTGTHEFRGALSTGVANSYGSIGAPSGFPQIRLVASGSAVDARVWSAYVDSTTGVLHFAAVNDANSVVKDAIAAVRSGGAVSAMQYGNSNDNPTHTFYGPALVQGTYTRAPSGVTQLRVGSIASGFPSITFDAASGISDQKVWEFFETSDGATLEITTLDDAATANKVAWSATRSANALTAIQYGNSTDAPSHTFSGIHNNSGGNLRSGTYTPTITLVSGGSSSTARVCQWMRVGNVVTVSGSVSIVETVATMQIGISLPIASALANVWELGGFIGTANVRFGTVSADAANDRAFATWTGISTTEEFSFTFTYLIL